MLIKFLSFCLIDQTAGRDEFHVNLHPLSGIGHLLIGFGDIFGIGKFFRHDPLVPEETVEPGNGAFIAPLHELHPEDDRSSMRIVPAHIPDKFDFFESMLVWMGMGTSGTVTQGVPGAVIAVFPAINILTVGLIFNGCFGNPITFSIFNK